MEFARGPHLEEVGEHEIAGNLDRVDLQGGASINNAAVTGARTHTQHHRLSGAQELVIHLGEREDPLSQRCVES